MGAFDHVEVLGLKEGQWPSDDRVGEDISICRIEIKSKRFSKVLAMQWVKYIEWVYRLMKKYRGKEVSVVHCHGVGTLPAAVVLKWRFRTKLVYDAHELETESAGLRGARKILSKFVERIFIKYADSVLVVSDSIATWYEQSYSMPRPYIVRNVPYLYSSDTRNGLFRKLFDLSDSALIFLYQGGFEPGRGLDAMLNAFTRINGDRHLILMGYGSLTETVKRYAREHASIHYQPAVSPDDLLKYTASADVGLSLIEGSCLSYVYSMPNKLFEYMMAGLPIIGSNLPEIRKVISSHDCGWVVDADAEHLEEMVNHIDSITVRNKAEAAKKARHAYSWEKEQNVLLAAYNA